MRLSKTDQLNIGNLYEQVLNDRVVVVERDKKDDPLEGTCGVIVKGKPIDGKVKDFIEFAKRYTTEDFPLSKLKSVGFFNNTPKPTDKVKIGGEWMKYRDATKDQQHDFNERETEGVNKSNLKYPILLVVGKGNSNIRILDGNHRAAKAIGLNHKTIKAKIIPEDDLSDYNA